MNPSLGCVGATDKAKISGLYVTPQYSFKLNGVIVDNVSTLILESNLDNNIYMPFEAVLENGNHGVSVSVHIYNIYGAVIPNEDYAAIGYDEVILAQFYNLGNENVQIEIISKNREQAPIVIPDFNPTAVYHADKNSVSFCLAPQKSMT